MGDLLAAILSGLIALFTDPSKDEYPVVSPSAVPNYSEACAEDGLPDPTTGLVCRREPSSAPSAVPSKKPGGRP